MRIFYAADSSPNPGIASNLWRRNLHDTLVDLGHEVLEFDYDMRRTFGKLDPAIPGNAEFIAKNRPELSAELVRQVRAAHAKSQVRLFFSYFYDACVLPAALDEIRAMGIVTVNWYCNASYQFHLVREIAPHYNWCLVPEAFRIGDYKAIGARPIYCQEAASPKVYHPVDVPKQYDVTFVGQAYGDRPEIVKFLRARGIDVRVWGQRWEHHVAPVSRNPLRQWLAPAEGLSARVVGGVLSDEEMVTLFSQSRINLGFSSCGETHRERQRILQVRLRDFEVPMSGGFYLVEHQPELEAFFTPGVEIATYNDRFELEEKIRFYLTNEDARESVRRAGYARAIRDHTWRRRFEDAFAQMNLA